MVFNSTNRHLNHISEWYLGPFYGIVPGIFSVVPKIHHTYHGGIGDSYTSWDFERDNILNFIWYIARWFHHSI